MQHNIEFHPVIVTERPSPSPDAYAPLPVDPVGARVMRAAEVVEGDIILAEFVGGPMARTTYEVDAYEAHPKEFNASCGCVSCELPDDRPGPYTVLTDGFPWDMCDVWPVNGLALVVPAARLR